VKRQPVVLGWELADDFGWGIVGQNIFRQWARTQDIAPVMLSPIQDMPPSPDNPPWIREAVAASNQMATKLAGMMRGPVKLPFPVVHALGNQLLPLNGLSGTPNIARAVFEYTVIDPQASQLARYDAMVTACEWNAALLRAHVKVPVHVIHEAVDHARFAPGPAKGLLPPSRFYIFTGGKIEFRKAQDLVLLAFREFSRRHDDAVLVTAWQSPWPKISEGFLGKLAEPLQATADGKLDIARWVAENGIDPAKVIDLGRVPNQAMADILREVACALQPSRAEAATNLVAMEAMACGLPVIVGRNTGMLDLIAQDNCIALERQSRIEYPTTEGWGESDVEEILEALESLYDSASLRARIGAQAHAFMKTRTWAGHAEALRKVVLG
jgi:glycosyltransferase involved in cell wall biosynthesis